MSSMICVEVNVGGRVFKASPATLRKSPFFAELLREDLADDLQDGEGRLFIDRDPELFTEVLRLLRGYSTRVPSGGPDWESIKAEADFYQVPLDLCRPPVEVVPPPDILTMRRLYVEINCPETLRRDEICMYSLSDLPPDLLSLSRIVGVEVNRHQCGNKTVFIVSRLVLQEAGFADRSEGLWERIERRCYHRLTGLDLVVPRHPTEVCREKAEQYLCITYALPPVGPVIIAGGGVVGVQQRG